MTFPTPAEWIDQRFTVHYVEWRRRRVDAIRAHYGDQFFDGKTVLELGCGYGDIGATFAKLGARVTCCDARPEHLDVLSQRWPNLSVVVADLNHQWPFDRFDVILHLGVLYHLEPSHESLRRSCRHGNHLVLETEVLDSSSSSLIARVDEDGYDQAVDGRGCRPTAARVERILREEGMRFERVADGRCNSGMHVYDWPVTESGEYRHGQRRFWFARKDDDTRSAARVPGRGVGGPQPGPPNGAPLR